MKTAQEKKLLIDKILSRREEKQSLDFVKSVGKIGKKINFN